MLALISIAIVAVCAFVFVWIVPTWSNHALHFQIVHGDGKDYYAYLPAFLLEHDPSFRTWMLQDRGLGPGVFTLEPGGAYLDVHQIGEAIMLSPFFIVGHGVALGFGENADGYSTSEQIAIGLGGVAYFVTGCALLRRSLLRYWSPRATASALLALVFGSNLFEYGAVQVTYNHVYSFFLVCALIELSIRWHHDGQRWRDAVLVGATVALLVLIRDTGIIFGAIFLGFGLCTSESSARMRLALLRARWRQLVLMAVIGIVLFLPQMFMWHEATGHWIANAYAAFPAPVWWSPNFFWALISLSPPGFLAGAPIVAIALAGLWIARSTEGALAVPAVAITIGTTYVAGTWYDWPYQWGFGHRGFVEALPLFAFGLAAAFDRLRETRVHRLMQAWTVLSCVAILVESLDYWRVNFGTML